MTKLKCPFCGKPLQPTHRIEDEYFCENYDCPQTSITWIGTSSLWQALIDTKKKLDIAVDALKMIDDTRSVVKENLFASYGKSLNSGIVFCWTIPDEIHNTLKQINQKDVK